MTYTQVVNELMKYYMYAYTSNLFFVLITGFCDILLLVNFYKYKKFGDRKFLEKNKAMAPIVMFSNLICFLGIFFSFIYSGILTDYYSNHSYFYSSCVYLGIEIILIGINVLCYIVSPE